MRVPKDNYIKKANDLYFCLNRFIDNNINKSNTIYVFHLDSKTKDYNLFRNKILKNWKLAFGRKYECSAVGAVEHDSNGYWHCHILVAFKYNYKPSTFNNIKVYGRKLWIKFNFANTGIKLKEKRFLGKSLIYPEERFTAYASKPLKHQRKSFTYMPKAFDQFGSFRVTMGSANKLWDKKELPSYKYSVPQLEKNLKEICRERRKYIFNEKYLIKYSSI